MSEALFVDRYGKLRRPAERGGGDREKWFNRFLVLLVVALSLFLIGELAYHLLIAPRLTVRRVTIRSDLSLSKQDVLAVAGIGERSYYFSLDPGEIRRRLEALPMVREAAVQKVFPDTLNITLRGRLPVSMLFSTTPEGRSVPLCVDDQGVVFQIGSAVDDWDLPIIAGVEFKRLEVGMSLPQALLPVLKELQSLKAEDPQLYRVISEIRPIARSGSIAEILLYPVQYPVRLRMAGHLDPAVMRNAFIVLDLLDKQRLTGRISELDMRTGDVVYRMEEE